MRQSAIWTGLLGLGLLLGGCDGGGPPRLRAVFSKSFYPLEARGEAPGGGASTKTSADISGKRANIRWVYRVNDGEPITTSEQGVSISIIPNDIKVRVSKKSHDRKLQFDGRIEGSASDGVQTVNVKGKFSEDVVESFIVEAGRTEITSQSLDINIKLKAQGESGRLKLTADADYLTPVEWFPDRENLDAFPVDYVFRPDPVPTAHIVGKVNILGDKFPLEETVSSPETWTIEEKLSSMTVQGIEWLDVVVVRRTAALAGRSFDFDTESVSVRYWLARGIGIVRAEGLLTLLGEPLVIELVDTNLVQTDRPAAEAPAI